MTVWLRRQEAIHQQCSYLQWAVPGYIAEIEGEHPDMLLAEDVVMAETGADDEIVVDDQQQTTYTVAKKPAIVGASIKTINDEYDTPDFISVDPKG